MLCPVTMKNGKITTLDLIMEEGEEMKMDLIRTSWWLYKDK